MTEQPATMPISVRVTWPVDAAGDSRIMNQVALLDGPPLGGGERSDGTVYLIFGHLAPPLIADPQALAEFTEAGSRLDVTNIVSIALPRSRAEELHALLSRHLAGTNGGDGGADGDE